MDLLEHIKDLKYIATRDYLTGLCNRRHFFEVGEKLFNRAVRSQKNIAVGIIDIDFFKTVNDTYGHDVGDIVLKRIADLLASSFRVSDLVARLGGEEFCFLLPNISSGDALMAFENLRIKIEQDTIILPDHPPLKITASMGVCTSIEKNLETALNKADKLLFEAKKNGRNQVILK
jgi:diguanylate cyclase (GGDEF)-like protein